jgi:homoserine kinase
VRVAGAVLAVATADDPDRWLERRDEVQALVARLEGHPDNVAASLYGGVVVAAAGRVVRLPVALDPTIVVWVPSSSTSTDESRRTLAAKVTRDDAVFNVGRTALLVAALATGDVESLRDACADRLHQDHRLAAVPRSRAALDAALENGAWAAWLSGSGPTVAAMCAPDDAARLAAVMDTATRTGAATDEPALGRTMVLRIDQRGATLERS